MSIHVVFRIRNFFVINFRAYTTKLFYLLLTAFLISCDNQPSYLPSGKNKNLHYEIIFIDKEKITKKY